MANDDNGRSGVAEGGPSDGNNMPAADGGGGAVEDSARDVSEGTVDSESTTTEGDNRAEPPASPEEAEEGTSCGELSEDSLGGCGVVAVDAGGSSSEEAGEAIDTDDADGDGSGGDAKGPAGGEESEKVVILPGFGDDPIILPSKPKQVKSDAESGAEAAAIEKDSGETENSDASPGDDSASPDSDAGNGTEDDANAEEGETEREGVPKEDADASSNATGNETETEQSPESDSGSGEEKADEGDAPVIEDDTPSVKLVDYASKQAGAQVLEQSSSLKGASNLLTGDKDKYSIAPCEDKKYVVVGLSEDILVKQIKLSNYERYSSRVRTFEVLASQEYPAPNEEYWTSIGTYEAQSRSGEQSFELEEPAWARYLKFRFLSHYGAEHYCTLSQLKVHGSTMLQGFHEQWIETEKKEQEEGEAVGDETVGEGGEAGDGEPSEAEEEEHPDSEEAEEEGGAVSEDVEDEAESAEEEGAVIEGGANDEETYDQQNGAASPVDGEGTESDEVATPPTEMSEESLDSKEPQQEDLSNSAETPEKIQTDDPDKIQTDDNDETVGVDSPEEENEGADQGRDTVDENEAAATDEVLDEDSGGSDAHSKPQTTTSDEKGGVDERDTAQPDTKETLVTIGDDDELPRNDSSIAAVTDVVKAAVADASGAIKNATTGALANVKGAIHRTVAPSTTNQTDEGDNGTLVDETISEVEGGLENKSVAAPKEGDATTETIAETPSKAIAHHTLTATKDVAAKPKTEAAPSKGGNGTEATVKSTPKKKTAAPKEDSKATAKTSPEKKAASPKEGSKATTTATGRDMLRRGTITLAGKDGKDSIEISAGELYAKLSRRFPHAACLKDLDYQAFKSKGILANAGGSVGSGGGTKIEPIFAKITHEIKSVQTTQTQVDQYISALKACYESVLWDVAKDLDSMQTSVDQRLANLERAAFLSEMRPGGRGSRAYRRMTNLLPFFPKVGPVLQYTIPGDPVALLGCVATLLVLLWGLSRRSKAKKRTDSVKQSAEAVSGPSRKGDRPSNGKQVTFARIDSPQLESENSLREEEPMAKELADKSKKLSNLQNENASLQQRCSQLEQAVASLRMEQRMNEERSGRGIPHLILNDDGNAPTPTPSVQSEPLTSDAFTTPTKSGRSPMNAKSC